MTPAQSFIAGIKGQGPNIERTNLVAMGFNTSSALWQTYFAAGVRVVRGFVPASVSSNFGLPGWPALPTADVIAPYLDAVALGIQSGVPVFLDFYDVMQPGDVDQEPAIVAYLQMVSGLIAARNFNPEMCAFGPVNEYASNGNSFWNIYRASFTAALRASAPNILIVCNAGDWGALSDYEDTTDPFVIPATEDGSKIIVQVHDYSSDAADPAHWGAIKAGMDGWSAANGGAPWHIGEAGFNGVNGPFAYDPVQYPKVIEACQAGAPGSAACFWAVTNGANFPMNVGTSDPTLQPAVVTAFQATSGGTAPPQISVSNPGTVTVGSPAPVEITGTASQISIIAVHNDAATNYPFYAPQSGSGPFDTVSPTDGKAIYAQVLTATGDFYKFGPVGGPYTDTAGVTLVQATTVTVALADLAAIQTQAAALQADAAAVVAALEKLMPATGA